MKYYLIGMPGSGKSTVGKELKKITKCELIDLDSYIEKKAGRKIQEIFKECGESYFRDLETEALKDLLDKDNLIVSCGGGIVVRSENKSLMNGIVVYLRVSLENLKIRLASENSQRPLMQTNTVEDLYQRRKELYEDFANIIISNNIVSKCAQEILKEAKNYAKK